MPLHQYTSLLQKNTSTNNNYINPAMIPTPEFGQLPLHIVVDEFLYMNDDIYYILIKTIYDSYPSAILIQDYKGRTPLHSALSSFHKWISYPPDPRGIDILFKNSNVTYIIDDYGNIPFDILLKKC